MPVQRHWPHFFVSLSVRVLTFLLLGYLVSQYMPQFFYFVVSCALIAEFVGWFSLQKRLASLTQFGFDGQLYLVSNHSGRIDCRVVGCVRVTHFLVALLLRDVSGKRQKWPLLFSPCNCQAADFHRLRQFVVLNSQYI